MRTLVVGVGALGGIIAARLIAAGEEVWLGVRDEAAARRLRERGLRVSGVGGAVSVGVSGAGGVGGVGGVGPIEAFEGGEGFDLIVLATKADDAIAVAPRLAAMLRDGGTLLPIQNGGVPQLLAERLGACVLGGLSNLGATMVEPGVYEQRNAGHLLVGELGGDRPEGPDAASERAERVRAWLGRGVEVRTTANMRGAVWSKLLLNCSVTTIGAIAGRTMREYLGLPGGREAFDRAYAEALGVALASGARPERMLVEPEPPRDPEGYGAWLEGVLAAYGDLKPSMLQDFERGRRTEIDYINGYVADLGRRLGVPTPVNAAIVEAVRAITRGEARPDPRVLRVVAGEAAG